MDLHEQFEEHYASMWPMDRTPFARRFAGSPDYAMEKVQDAWKAFPATLAWLKAQDDATHFGSGWIRIAPDGSIEHIARETIHILPTKPVT